MEKIAAGPWLHDEISSRRAARGHQTPILTGLPFGHVATKVCLPVGAKVELVVQGRDVLIGW